MQIPFLVDILIILSFSVFVVLILNRFKLPSILGFLITGIVIGPYGLSLVHAIHEVEVLAEFGVILLLFVIGMELSISHLVSIKKTVFIGGFLQVGLTVALTAALSKFFGYSWPQAVFLGFLFSLSSTAIVLKVLQDMNQISSPHGRNALGILIFQDIIVVPMMLVTPIMSGQSTDIWQSILGLIVKSVLVVILTYVLSRYIMPRLMHRIAQTKSKELFLLATIAICFAVAFLTSQAGLSLALGAFIAGLIISESEYSHQATGTILPFRELFTSFFFISVGMLLDLTFFIQNIEIIVPLVVAVFVVKGSLGAVATYFLSYPPRTVILTGLSLFQVGEFAFILSKVGIEFGLVTPIMNQYFLAVSICTMLLTPFVLLYSNKLTSVVLKTAFQKKYDQKAETSSTVEQLTENLNHHLIVIGYGINGRNVGRAARYAEIPYIILELNPTTVKKERKKGERIIYGDAVHDHILHTVHLERARVVVIAISDPSATKAIISNIRHMNQSVYVIVRTRYVSEIDELIALGADEVIPEEFETSIEIFSRVLVNYLVPMDELTHLVDTIRADNYQMLRPQNRLSKQVPISHMPDLKIVCVRALADSGSVVGHTIGEANIRKKFGVNVLAISRKDIMLSTISADEKIHQHDLLFVSGDHEHVEKFYQAMS